MMSRLLRPLPLTAGLLLAGWLVLWLVRAERGLARAEWLARQGRWSTARVDLKRYLLLHPFHDAARLRLAECLVNDELLPAEEAAAEAVLHLERIEESSPLAPLARTQQGRLELLILLRPAAAERSLRQALAWQPDQAEAHYTLWKLLELTGRSDEASRNFWGVYEAAPPADRPARLREWYMCQFFPLTAHPQLERHMGLLGPEEMPDARTELRRFGEFRRREPAEPLAHAAIGHWLLREGAPQDAVQTLDEARDNLSRQASGHPFFLATLVAALLDLGEFERATTEFQRWSRPREGYRYWKLRAMLLDEVQRNDQGAVEAYRHALSGWPGPVDWRTRNRLANCLARLGRHEDAAKERRRAKKTEQLMENDVHGELREALGNLDSPATSRKMASFYEQLGCRRLAAAWNAELQRLESNDS